MESKMILKTADALNLAVFEHMVQEGEEFVHI